MHIFVLETSLSRRRLSLDEGSEKISNEYCYKRRVLRATCDGRLSTTNINGTVNNSGSSGSPLVCRVVVVRHPAADDDSSFGNIRLSM